MPSQHHAESLTLNLPAEIQMVIIEHVFSDVHRKSHWKQGFALALAIPSFTVAIRRVLERDPNTAASSEFSQSNLQTMRASREREIFFNTHWRVWDVFFDAAASNSAGMKGEEAELFYQICKLGVNYEAMRQLHEIAETKPSSDYNTPSVLQWWEQNQHI